MALRLKKKKIASIAAKATAIEEGSFERVHCFQCYLPLRLLLNHFPCPGWSKENEANSTSNSIFIKLSI